VSRDRPPVAYMYGRQQWKRSLASELSEREDVLHSDDRVQIQLHTRESLRPVATRLATEIHQWEDVLRASRRHERLEREDTRSRVYGIRVVGVVTAHHRALCEVQGVMHRRRLRVRRANVEW